MRPARTMHADPARTRFGIVLALMLPLTADLTVRASTIPVTNLGDSGPGSLRDALNSAAPGDTVAFQAGLTGTIPLTSGTLTLSKNVTITGPGAAI